MMTTGGSLTLSDENLLGRERSPERDAYAAASRRACCMIDHGFERLLATTRYSACADTWSGTAQDAVYSPNAARGLSS